MLDQCRGRFVACRYSSTAQTVKVCQLRSGTSTRRSGVSVGMPHHKPGLSCVGNMTGCCKISRQQILKRSRQISMKRSNLASPELWITACLLVCSHHIAILAMDFKSIASQSTHFTRVTPSGESDRSELLGSSQQTTSSWMTTSSPWDVPLLQLESTLGA